MAIDYRDILILNSAYDEDHAGVLLKLLKENNVTDNIDTIKMLVDYDTTLQNIDAAMSETRLLLVLMSEDWCKDKEAKGTFLTALEKKMSPGEGEERQATMRLVYMLPKGCRISRDLPYYGKLPAYITMIMNITWKLDDASSFSKTVTELLENIKKLQPQKPPTESSATGTSQPASRDETDQKKQTDDPIMKVEIQKCDPVKAETLMTTDKVYKMSSKPRGRAVIINNIEFKDPEKNRIGADYDTVNLDNLLGRLGFTVKAYANQTSKQIRDIISRENSEKTQHGDCFILFLLSHGDSKHIYGTQRDPDPVNVDTEIVEKFYANVCPQLEGKPVLIFCGACRGKVAAASDQLDKEVATTGEDVDEVTVGIDQITLGVKQTQDGLLGQETEGMDELDANPSNDATSGTASSHTSSLTQPRKANVTDIKHIFKFYATVDGFEAIRSTDLGTYFVRAIVDVFSKHCHEDDLITLFKMVQDSVEDKGFLPVYEPRSNMDLYFFPGYYKHYE